MSFKSTKNRLKMEQNSTFVLGDIHGDVDKIFDWSDIARSGDTLVQVGDFGVGFMAEWVLVELGAYLKDKGVHCFAIRGNHDDPAPFRKGEVYDNLHLVDDFSIIEINGETCLFIGGAISVDRIYRSEGHSYWKDEGILTNLELYKGTPVHHVFSHTAPDFLVPVPKDLSNIRGYLENDPPLEGELIAERLCMGRFHNKIKNHSPNLKTWHYGHFHVSQTDFVEGVKYKCLNINEIVML